MWPLLLGAAMLISVGKALHVLLSRRSGRRAPVRLVAAAWVFACTGPSVFLVYDFIGFARPADEVCADWTGKDPDAYVGLQETRFPRSFVCRWTDGTTTDLIPAWVNPVLFLAIAGVAGCLGAASVIAVRRARSR